MRVFLRRAEFVSFLAAAVICGYAFPTGPGPAAGAEQGGLAGMRRFPHKVHLELDIGCSDCHVGAASSEEASDNIRATIDACTQCHETEDKEVMSIRWYASPENPTVGEIIRSELTFSHKAHIARGLECEHCHPGEDGAQAEPSVPPMETCFECHEGMGGRGDCATCHSQLAILRPENHDFDWIHHHGDTARQEDETCRHCHNEDYCQECHEGGTLLPTQAAPTDHFIPYGPLLSGQGMVIEGAHDLNYRYTHPLDAEGKERECSTCHDYESFCADCHVSNEKAEDDPSQFMPAWHGGADWGAIPGGVGTGGGRHGEMARRDIERCAACHEVSISGADPTCLSCHRDSNWGMGNDPSTHEAGFADGLGKGDWHDDNGAICYVCHTRSQEAGDGGFCGYCHGPKQGD